MTLPARGSFFLNDMRLMGVSNFLGREMRSAYPLIIRSLLLLEEETDFD
jgi:hypothetical protein